MRDLASCGGIAQDHNGNLVAAWSLNLGFCTVTTTELWAIRSLGFTSVLLEIDSLSAKSLIDQEIPETPAHIALVSAFERC